MPKTYKSNAVFLLLGIFGTLLWQYTTTPQAPDQPATPITPPTAAISTQTTATTVAHLPAKTPDSSRISPPRPVIATETIATEAPLTVSDTNTDDLLTTAERDSDPNVRLAALERVQEAGVIPPQEWLEQVLRNDTLAEMRAEAFRLLTDADLDTTTLYTVATTALSDPSDTIRTRAQDLLTDMAVAAAQPTQVQAPDTTGLH